MDTLEALKAEFDQTGEVAFTIPVAPVTKKNHSQIIKNRKTGKRMVIPSKQYTAYLDAVREYIPALGIECRVNVKAVFYLKARYKADLTNLCQALHDVMVACGCVADDNCRIIAGMDGTEAKWDKTNPRTEVTITKKGDQRMKEKEKTGLKDRMKNWRGGKPLNEEEKQNRG